MNRYLDLSLLIKVIECYSNFNFLQMNYTKHYLKCDSCKCINKVAVIVERTLSGKIIEIRAKPCTHCGMEYEHSELIRKIEEED